MSTIQYLDTMNHGLNYSKRSSGQFRSLWWDKVTFWPLKLIYVSSVFSSACMFLKLHVFWNHCLGALAVGAAAYCLSDVWPRSRCRQALMQRHRSLEPIFRCLTVCPAGQVTVASKAGDSPGSLEVRHPKVLLPALMGSGLTHPIRCRLWVLHLSPFSTLISIFFGLSLMM